MFVALFVFVTANTAGAAWMASTATKITKTSSSSDVMWLQETLNAVQTANLAVDGKYGPKTTSAIVTFQKAHPSAGYADGIAGPKTIAALNAAGANLSPAQAGTYPAGCTSSMGFSSTTGMPCTSGTATYPAGCTSSIGFSPTTGMSCSAGAVVNNGAEGTLSSVAKLSSYNSTKVIEGAKDVVVLGIEATAKDGNQNIDTVKVAFKNANGSSSVKLMKYVSDISVWLDGKEIGRKSVASFSDDAGDVYTYRFTGMNGMIPVGTKSKILVAVSGASSMDSTDATNESWSIGAGTTQSGTADYITASSANGRYVDYGSSGITSTIDFQKAGGVSSDQKYRVSTASTNPVAQTTQVSRTQETLNKVLLAFDAKAENGAMKIQRIPVTVTTANGGADGVAPNPEAIVKVLRLFANGTEIANESITTGVSPVTVTFGNTTKLGYAVAANATVKFEVKADLNDIEETGVASTDFDEGDTLKVDYSTTNVTNSTIELDNVNGDTVSNRSGSGAGEVQTARSTGVLVTMGAVTSDTPVTNTSGEILSRTLNIPVTVTAFDDTVYLARAVNQGTTVTDNTSAFGFTVEDSTGATKAVTSTGTLTSSTATVSGSAFTVNSGDSKTFMVTVTIPGTTGQAIKQYRVQLNAVQTYLANDLTTGVNEQVLTPSNAFETGYYTLTLN